MSLVPPTKPCTPPSFSSLSLYGPEISSLSADIVTGYNYLHTSRYSQPFIDVENATFCNDTVTYTHPGQGDAINAEIWLPLTEWSGILQSVGGGGWTAGRNDNAYAGMAGGIVEGYATATTDAGRGEFDNFGHRSLADLLTSQTRIAKEVASLFYGQAPQYSYWNGCSNGGRQASILAQQYPEAYDGIIAAAPAMHWAELYPQGCELAELTSIAIAECDLLDGVEDEIISDLDGRKGVFRAENHVGTPFTCAANNSVTEISAAAADAAMAVFNGPTYSNGDFMWYGYEIGTDLSILAPFFVLRDPGSNITSLTHQQYDQLYLTLKKVLAPHAGGKMITLHGLADEAIPPESTLHYFHQVSRIVDNTTDFYRYYRVPGLEHCSGGPGGQPIHLFNQLRAWVESGTAPGASPVSIRLPGNETMEQIICPVPLKAVRRDHNEGEEERGSWKCE
ncbi:tannase and feruloyl esterase-domain-containing protein [Aspergillus crustosus]